MMASFLQYMLPGMPSLYYADETGMEGYKDPFNRRTYPWGREDETLLKHHRQLGQLRKELEVLRLGDIRFFHAAHGKLGFIRQFGGKTIRVYVNHSQEGWEIAEGTARMSKNLRERTLMPLGFCIMEE